MQFNIGTSKLIMFGFRMWIFSTSWQFKHI